MSCQNNPSKAGRAAGTNGISRNQSQSAYLAPARAGNGNRSSRSNRRRTARSAPAARSGAPARRPANGDRPDRAGRSRSRTAVPARDALLQTLSQQGRLDWAEMARLSGLSQARLQQDLVAAGLLFQNPAGGWETRDQYLSGNVSEKLAQAKAAAKTRPAFEANVAALKKVQPRPLKPGQIFAPLGAGWIPPQIIKAFGASLGLGLKVEYLPALAKWTVRPNTRFKKERWRSAANNQIWGSRDIEAIRLLEQALNGREPTVRDRGRVDRDRTYLARAKQQKIIDAFDNWLWRDPARARQLARRYNERYNTHVPRRYDGAHLSTLPGMNPAITLRPNQKDAIWRLLRSPANTFLVHDTGFGKTFSMQAASMEMRRLGLRKKIVHVVPNHRLASHAAEFKRLYPQVKLKLVPAEAVSKRQRQQTLQKLAQSKADVIIMTHSAMEAIPVSQETEMNQLRQQIEAYDETLASLPYRASRSRKALRRTRDRQQSQLEKLAARPARPDLNWDDLGVDQLFVDEVHRYKNLGFATGHRRILGLNPRGSARARKLLLKVRSVQQRCDRCGKFKGDRPCQACGPTDRPQVGKVCFASATPLDNSLAEIFTWQRFLQPKRLKALGLSHFDAWAAQFARPVRGFELDLSGQGYKESTRFATFSNVPELSTLLGEVADVRLGRPEALGLSLPRLSGEGRPIDVVVPMSERVRAYMAQSERRIEAVRAGLVPPEQDNYLKIATDMAKASLDFRLIDPAAPDDPDSKVNHLVRLVRQTYRQTTGVSLPGLEGPQNLSQVIFLDTSTPKAGFNLYDDIKRKLVAAGLPAEQIAFIHQAQDAQAKQRLFEQVNAGQIRVLLASTPLAGEGANFQKRLKALYHLDSLWTPRKYQQRNGRLLRPGNRVPEVDIYRFVTETSPDAYRWQTIERKALFADQVLRGEAGRSVEDVGPVQFDYATIKALASGNPLVKQQVALRAELQAYQGLERLHRNRQFEAQQALETAEQELALLRLQAPGQKKAQAKLARQIEAQRAIVEAPFEQRQKLAEVQAALRQIDRQIDRQIAQIDQAIPSPGPVRRLLGGLRDVVGF